MSESVDDLASVLTALGHPNRLQLLLILTGGPRYSSDLAAAAGLSAALATHHLGILLRAGIVDRRQAGRQREYVLVPEVPAAAADLVRQWLVGGPPEPTTSGTTGSGPAGSPRRRSR